MIEDNRRVRRTGEWDLWFALALIVILLGVGGARARRHDQAVECVLRPHARLELYEDYNKAFAAYWLGKTGDTVAINQSHGGSGKQARSVIDGLEADVVTLALAYDIDALATQAALVPANWQSRLPNNSTPYTSTIVFLVRKGNPKGIHDWNDLVKPGVSVHYAESQDIGRGALELSGGVGLRAETARRHRRQCRGLRQEVVQERSGARFRGAAARLGDLRGTRHRRRAAGMGERGALLAVKEFGPPSSISCPSLSIVAEPPVAVVDQYVDQHGTRKVAEEYLKYLYSAQGRRLPRSTSIARAIPPWRPVTPGNSPPSPSW